MAPVFGTWIRFYDMGRLMKYGVLFLILAALCLVVAVQNDGWHWLWLWPGFSFFVVAMGYLFLGPAIFGKSSKGVLAITNQIVLLPYLVFLWSVWHLSRLVKREPAFHFLNERFCLARRLLPHELPDGIDHIVDLTCEFTEPMSLRCRSYNSFPILDGFVPRDGQLTKWIEHVANLNGTILIHCAEGHGRTGLFAAGLLLYLHESDTAENALRMVQAKRPSVRLGRLQFEVLRNLQSSFVDRDSSQSAPVSHE